MNKLDQYGINWLNPQPNTDIVSAITLLSNALIYRYLLIEDFNITTYTNPYDSFRLFRLRAENLMNTHRYLHPSFVNTQQNFSDRVSRAKELFNLTNAQSANAGLFAMTIMEWSDLEDITGEDLTEFKDGSLRVNEVWSTNLLTKMYKIVDAFKYTREQSNRDSHLIGEFLGQTQYTNSDLEQEYTNTSIWTGSFSNEDGVNWPSIYRDPNNAYNEFVSNLSRRSADTINLTTQVNKGIVYPDLQDPDYFRTSKQWLFRAEKTPEFNTIFDSHLYSLQERQRGFYGCPITPRFSRGNSTQYYQSRTEVFANSESQDITNIDFYESYVFYQKTENGTDFGTGLTQNDGGVISYSKNQNNTMFTDVFANFNYSSSLYPKDPNLATVDVPPNYYNDNTLRLVSNTFFNLNDAEFNLYKTTL